MIEGDSKRKIGVISRNKIAEDIILHFKAVWYISCRSMGNYRGEGMRRGN